MAAMRYRNWCFTENNPEGLLDPGNWPDCTYCVYQEEIGENGTYHLQGYVEFSVRHRLGGVKAATGMSTAHFEWRRGSAKQASDYCQKAESRVGGPYIFGAITGQGPSWLFTVPLRYRPEDLVEVCNLINLL